jgi:hypothetical protein
MPRNSSVLCTAHTCALNFVTYFKDLQKYRIVTKSLNFTHSDVLSLTVQQSPNIYDRTDRKSIFDRVQQLT